MITAKDIRKKKFEKIKFGFNPEEVDAFLAEVESDLRLMEQELADSNNKVQLLADKVREYKASEEDLKNALIGAQKQAREVLAEANAKAASIEEEAKAQASAMHAAAMEEQEEQLRRVAAQLEEENRALVATQRQVANFKKTLFEMYKEHLEQISKLPETAEELEEAVVEEEAVEAEAEAEVVAEAEIVEDSAAADSWDSATEVWGDSPNADAAQPAVDPFRTSEFSREAVRAEQESRFSDLQFGSRRDDRRRDDRRKKRS